MMGRINAMQGAISSLSVQEFSLSSEDIPYEEDILKNPYSLNSWGRYLDHKKHATFKERNMIYERAVQELPGSYKLWKAYLDERRQQVKYRNMQSFLIEEVNHAYERALIFLHKMPRLWLDYGQFLIEQKKITQTRHTFDRALRSLPVTQHQRIWDVYIEWIKTVPVVDTVIKVFRRYLKFRPDEVENYIDYLIRISRLDEAASKIVSILDNPDFVSIQNKTKQMWWLQLAELVGMYPGQMGHLNIENIIRSGLKQCDTYQGKLWICLADYYIRLGHFEKARDIFEDGIRMVMSVRDFSQIFDAYAQFEESVISAHMEGIQDVKRVDGSRNEWDTIDLDLRLARLEALIDRRPLLVNEVLLRQDPNHVQEWLKRTRLYKEQKDKVIETYQKALKTVNPKQAHGRASLLWIHFAKYYESHQQDIQNSRNVFENAVKIEFRNVEELATVWLEYVEMELRIK
jgi:pre-mRNA-splicing factor SYF1